MNYKEFLTAGQELKITWSTTSQIMVKRAGPWYTYSRPATATEVATGISEDTIYDLEMLATHGDGYGAYLVQERERLTKKGIKF